MEEEFYAIVKLVSGEEIFSKVCPCDENDRTLLILEVPVIMESIHIRQMGITTVKVSPWIKMSDDDMFIIDMNKVITVTEINDSNMIKMHQKYIRNKNRKSGKTKISPNMGYLSTIADARVSLENLYNLCS